MAIINGTPGDDPDLFGTPENDEIRGFAGNDVALGLDGDDRLFGGTGNDVLDGEDGDDRLDGGPGIDALFGENGDDVLFAGPGDLRRAYDGDATAIENAIQTVLSACKEFRVPCGITAGPDDIAKRLEQGFRVIIVTNPEALPVGRRAAGRG